MSGKFSRTSFDGDKGKPWIVTTWFVNEEGKEFCQSVRELPSRKLARQFQHEQRERYFDPLLNNGAGI